MVLAKPEKAGTRSKRSKNFFIGRKPLLRLLTAEGLFFLRGLLNLVKLRINLTLKTEEKMKDATKKGLEIKTKNTMMCFVPRKDTMTLIYYGKRLDSASDIAKLWGQTERWFYTLGGNVQETYPAFGGDLETQPQQQSMNKHGALQVIHADGDPTVEWQIEKIEELKDQKGFRHFVFHYKDRHYPLFVKQHYRAAYDTDIIETWVEISHKEKTPIKLPYMDSLGLKFRGLSNRYFLQNLSGTWAAEAQLNESEIVRGTNVRLDARSGVRDAWGNNPSFMLSIGKKATETEGNVIAGALAWSGSWHIDILHDANDDLHIYGGPFNLAGPYILDPGKTLELPKFLLTYSFKGKGQVSRNFHTWARDFRIPRGHVLRDVLLNSWEGAYFSLSDEVLLEMMDGVKKIGGEMFVIDDGWFAQGEYVRNNGKTGLGDWTWNFDKLPKGLNFLVKEAKKRGLKLGLWFEPEMANTKSEIAEKHPDWIIRGANRVLRGGRGATQVVLDMSNPKVRENIFKQIDAILQAAPGLSYIKWDANADFMNYGSAFLKGERAANLWFDYTKGVYDLIAQLRKKYPKVVFQACSSGGAHAEYGFLEYAEEFWGSDDTDARQRVFIQWGEGQFYPANAMACHVTAVPSHQTGRVTPIKYRFDVAMSGRLGLELHPKNMTEEELAFSQSAVKLYKKTIRPLVQQGDLYRLVSPYDGTYASLMYTDKNAQKAIVFFYGLNMMYCGDYPPPVKLQGLDPKGKYKIEEINYVLDKKGNPKLHTVVDKEVLSGEALMEVGIGFSMRPEYDSAVLLLTKVK